MLDGIKNSSLHGVYSDDGVFNQQMVVLMSSVKKKNKDLVLPIVERSPQAAATTDRTFKQLHPVLQRIYSARGITDGQALDYRLSQLIPYQRLSGIAEAAQRLAQAIMRQEYILIVGDYDADGATSSALACLALAAMGATKVDFFVPDRKRHGYGLSAQIVEEVAATAQPDLLLTVDNGIASIAGVAAARAKGIDVLISDHHLAAKQLPEDCIIVNPNQPGDTFPSKNLAGVGVIFYVMIALRAHLKSINYFNKDIKEPNLADYLDLVALGTVADVVPLDYNNRILVQQGLMRMRAGKCRPGIAALVQIGKRQLEHLVSEDLGFCVGPRLNAAGRLADMRTGINCLLAVDRQRADVLAAELDQLNSQRRSLEGDMQAQAQLQIAYYTERNKALPVAICLHNNSWHEGVIGLIASRVKEQLHRPTIAFTKAQDGSLKGSGRSIAGLHLRDALAAVASSAPGLIQKFGGHAMAAGLSIRAAELDRFRDLFAQQVASRLSAADLSPAIYSDGSLSADQLSLPLAKLLKLAGPWGQAFPAPLFHGTFIVHQQRLLAERHLKMQVADPVSGICFDAIAFQVDLDLWPNHHCHELCMVYRLDINRYRGRVSLQLIVEALAAGSSHHG